MYNNFRKKQVTFLYLIASLAAPPRTVLRRDARTVLGYAISGCKNRGILGVCDGGTHFYGIMVVMSDIKEINSPKTPSFLGRFREWHEGNERVVSFAAFFGGFVLDNLTLSRIDRFFDMFVLFFWLIVAGASIFAINVFQRKFLKYTSVFLFVIQIAFGALFSGFTVIYMRSGSLAASFPFLALVVFLFVGNEFFRKRYLRLTFQASILFTALFFLMIFYVPILLGQMGAGTFLLSGAASLAIIFIFVSSVYTFLPKDAREKKTALMKSVGGIFLAVNILYFTNSIPPIPLSLKDAGPYHSLAKSPAGEYVLVGEHTRWFDFFKPHKEIRILYGEPVYFYSAVFAPTKLSTGIAHDWQYYDANIGEWAKSGKFAFGITGGRDMGYRGYSLKTNIRPGLWRVDVVTDRGQVIGRTKFMVIETETPVALETVVR